MGKNFIETSLAAKLANQEKLFIPYIMAGDGGLEHLNEQIDFLTRAGVSAIELGIPFSDPVADGPTIQAAGKRSLDAGTTLTGVLEKLAETKGSRKIPIILMSYLNPIYQYGIASFAKSCAEVGVDGIIIPDLPMEEEGLVSEHLQANEIALVRLAALTSTKERVLELAKRAEGFLYAVSVTGTTGARTANQAGVDQYLTTLKEVASVPVLAGFGISSAEQAKTLNAYADGVIVGSAIVSMLHEGKREAIEALIKETLDHSPTLGSL